MFTYCISNNQVLYIYPSITKIVHDLHWLPVWSRLYFKINSYLQGPHLPTTALSLESSQNQRYSSRHSLYPGHQPIPAICAGIWNSGLPQLRSQSVECTSLRANVVLGRSLLSARTLRPTTSTIPPTPQNFNYDHSLLSAVIAPSW